MLFTLKVSPNMTEFIIKKLSYELSSHAGLVFVGKYLKGIKFNSLVDSMYPVRSGVANSDILKSYLALLCLSSSTLPERNYMISLETGSKTQTTKRV